MHYCLNNKKREGKRMTACTKKLYFCCAKMQLRYTAPLSKKEQKSSAGITAY